MRKIQLILSFLFVSNLILAQNTDARYPAEKEIFPFGVVERIQSNILNEERILNIYLPQGWLCK